MDRPVTSVEKPNLCLRPAQDNDLITIWNLIYTDPDWKRTGAPYQALVPKSMRQFQETSFQVLKAGDQALLIEHDGKVIGSVSYYWENQATRWLEVGITIYPSKYCNQGLGRIALGLWLDMLFERHPVERIGLSTWSGAPAMIACAKAIGMQVEGIIRKVRYYDGEYYDSVMLGVLRAEWFAQQTASR